MRCIGARSSRKFERHSQGTTRSGSGVARRSAGGNSSEPDDNCFFFFLSLSYSQIISAIAYLHSLTIIYRDLKPHNVLVWSLDLQSGVRVKLADYGIARFSSAAGLKQMTGTEAYMAPEMWKTSGQATYDEKVRHTCLEGFFLFFE